MSNLFSLTHNDFDKDDFVMSIVVNGLKNQINLMHAGITCSEKSSESVIKLLHV